MIRNVLLLGTRRDQTGFRVFMGNGNHGNEARGPFLCAFNSYRGEYRLVIKVTNDRYQPLSVVSKLPPKIVPYFLKPKSLPYTPSKSPNCNSFIILLLGKPCLGLPPSQAQPASPPPHQVRHQHAPTFTTHQTKTPSVQCPPPRPTSTI